MKRVLASYSLILTLMLVFLLTFVPSAISPQIEKVVFVDYYRRSHTGGDSSGDPSPCNVTSDRSSKIAGGIRWTSFPVLYYINASNSGIDPADAKAAVVNAFNTWDAEEHPAGDFFAEAASATEANIVVRWEFIDGEGGVLAQAAISFNPRFKEIVSAEITFDSGDAWRVLTTLACDEQDLEGDTLVFDIENVAAHEIGHAIGFDHVNDMGSIYNTMYTYVLWEGETHKRTLGDGEKKGLEELYG